MIWFLLRGVRVFNSNLRVCALMGAMAAEPGFARSNHRVQLANLNQAWGKKQIDSK